jgi:hypothetical protein
VIKVEGPDLTAVIRRARDHTRGTVPLILEAAVSILLGCPLAQDNETHVLRQHKRGAMSYGLHLADKREFHFRPGAGGHAATTIDVFLQWNHGDEEPHAVLSTSEDVWTFFAALRDQQLSG